MGLISSRFIRRSCLSGLAVVMFFSFGTLFKGWYTEDVPVQPSHLPPLYDTFRQEEQQLAHYDTYAKSDVKYFWPANHVKMSGWGNVMQDLVLMALLAYETNRSYVFNDHVWNADGSLFSTYNGKLIPSRIPLTAILGGPMVGGPFPPGDNTPQAVSKDFFQRVCPNPIVLQVPDINDDHLRFGNDALATEMFYKWVEKLNSIDEPCVQVDPTNNQIFEIWVMGVSHRLLPIWPVLSQTPILKQWGWSPLIQEAFYNNRHLFLPSSSRFFGNNQVEDGTSILRGLLAVHIRRGDFSEHCHNLADWRASFNAFNSFPELRDKFTPPGAKSGDDDTEAVNLYLQHCYPDIPRIVQRVAEVVAESKEPLRYLYIMTNGDVEWVAELKAALCEARHWDRIASSRDLTLTWEQKFVAQALDMYIAQRAQVLIGNGWSSLTSNVVILRLARSLSAASIRFF